jgi:hypothetical protein
MRIIIETTDRGGVGEHAAHQTDLDAAAERSGAGFGALSLNGYVANIYDEGSPDGVGAASPGDVAPHLPDLSTGSPELDPRGFGALSIDDVEAEDSTAGAASGEGFGVVSFDE